MTTNPYFNNGLGPGFDSESSMLQDQTDELIQIFGMNVYYIPRTEDMNDAVLSENIQSSFNSYKTIEVMPKDVDGFKGGPDLMSQFGFEMRNETTLTISRRRFATLGLGVYPKEGDLIYIPTFKQLFEISFVEDENPFYMLTKQTTFDIKIRSFQYSQETFDTGVTELDTYMTNRKNVGDPSLDPFASNHAIDIEANNIVTGEEDLLSGNY